MWKNYTKSGHTEFPSPIYLYVTHTKWAGGGVNFNAQLDNLLPHIM